jgi:hypothetical protein
MPIKKATSLKDKIKSFESSGKINVSSEDLAEFSPAELEEESRKQEGPVKVVVPKAVNSDPLTNTPDNSTEKLSDTIARTDPIIDITPATESNEDLEEVVITPEDKERFLTSLITNARFELPFELFNGRIYGTFRSRKQKESLAILTQLRSETDRGKVKTLVEHATRTRQFCLTCQLKDLRGTKMPEFSEPMFPTIKDGKETDPEWIKNVEFFDNMDDGLLSALYKQFRIFEKKYWSMIENSEDQNFWKTGESS